jgi:hypothetical protein
LRNDLHAVLLLKGYHGAIDANLLSRDIYSLLFVTESLLFATGIFCLKTPLISNCCIPISSYIYLIWNIIVWAEVFDISRKREVL